MLDKMALKTYNDGKDGETLYGKDGVGLSVENRGNYMGNIKNRRLLSMLCALALAVSVCVPVSAAAEETEPVQTLTASEAREMQQTDAAVTALTDSDAYTAMSREERIDAALDQLDMLAQRKLVQNGSVYLDEENGMVSFAYSCGALGGILLETPEQPDEEEPLGEQELAQQLEEALETAQLDEENLAKASAAIYYAFDDPADSSRYPYYKYMQTYWKTRGLDTKLNTQVTVSSLRKLADSDLNILSAHGAYYTYQYGWLWKRHETEPVILLLEKSDFWNDLRYGFDLLNHRIIKINGMYAVTPDFFEAAYRSGQLEDVIVISETCEFYGKDHAFDASIAEALLDAGASAVVGYVNNVYTIYSRSMLWSMVNDLIEGETVQQAVENAQARYGEDDLVWYRAQGGKRPHAAASYPVLSGQADATLKLRRRGWWPLAA